MGRLTHAQAAELVGAAEREISRVCRRRHRVLITTVDGHTVVAVPFDRPDGAGRTGLLWLRKPRGYRGQMETYTPRRWLTRSRGAAPNGVVSAPWGGAAPRSAELTR